LLVDFYQQLALTYPQSEAIYLVLDNWPIHFHPDVLAALQDPALAWPLKRPANWPTLPSPHARRLDLPIQLLPLPTYAPWTNPIEKVWRLLNQTVLHLHRFEDDWDGLKQRVSRELNLYLQPSPELLRYVGLQDPFRLYHALFEC
jgi:transposase